MVKPKKIQDQPQVEAAKPEVQVEQPVVMANGLKRVKVTHEELMKLQADCKIVGYDPEKQEAIIK
jgi:hypothetical protein